MTKLTDKKAIKAFWIGLFELIYVHKHLSHCLGDLMKTSYDMFTSCLRCISI